MTIDSKFFIEVHREEQSRLCEWLGSWASDHGLSMSVEHQVVASTFAILCAPSDASEAGKRACLKFLCLFLYLDDLSGEEFDVSLNGLTSCLTDTSWQGEPLPGALGGLQDLLRDLQSFGRVELFVRAYLRYLQANAEEARVDPRLLSVEECREQRQATIATDVNLSLWCVAADIPFPEDPTMHDLWELSIELTYMCNDIASEEKDRRQRREIAGTQIRPEANVVLSRAQEYSVQGRLEPDTRAREDTIADYNKKIELFRQFRSLLLTKNATLGRFADMCSHMIDGNLESHHYTRSLRFPDPHEALMRLMLVDPTTRYSRSPT